MVNAKPYCVASCGDQVGSHAPREPQGRSEPPFFILVVATLLVAFVTLVEFLALDYFVVRVRPYPAEANDYDWALLLFPLLPIAILLLGRCWAQTAMSIPLIATVTVVGVLIGLPLIATVGLGFHFAIGGTF